MTTKKKWLVTFTRYVDGEDEFHVVRVEAADQVDARRLAWERVRSETEGDGWSWFSTAGFVK
jgi:hypothetical protein